ncbi:MAG: SGNH/GDSL hydrolase family protein [Candidatus Hydrogenedentes bacterium]|nr:SGNH/GDSL hydrolase family protein [Candidatus Hydrogenedentota bacterium]
MSSKQLPATMAKLNKKLSVKLVLLGDSISAGANASVTTGARPGMPPYGQLVADGLQARFGSPVEFKNFAVGGKATPWGIEEIDKIAPLKPDLTIIAFGMNDASGRTPADVYAANTKTMIDKVRAVNPAAEFVLVATMEGNPEWSATSEQHYLDYREKLLGMAGEGVVVADMTSVWRELLKYKKFADITGNGVNHPNDFGHRAYAQVILGLVK